MCTFIYCLSSNCCNKNSTDCGLNNKCLFLTVVEAGKSKIRVLADLVSGEDPLPGYISHLLTVSLHVAESELHIRGLTPCCGPHPHDLI